MTKPTCLLVGLLVALTASSSRAGDDEAAAAKQVLAKRGLVHSGGRYVATIEKAALEKFALVNVSFADYQRAAAKIDEMDGVESRMKQLLAERQELQREISTRQAQVNAMPIARRRNNYQKEFAAAVPVLQNNLNQLNQKYNQLKGSKATPQTRKAAVDDLKRLGGLFKTEFGELETQMNEVSDKYKELGADAEVKGALATLTRVTKAPAKLGPSDQFKHAIKKVIETKKILGQILTTSSKPASSKN